ncbi:hypothetical protein P9265_07585 [Schinkia azotoformans]|uniref:hypothetical protein n=1 Tax=Schinkia azotoformans TaxID=1454 RepID=UPI002E233A0F|nr:hypothetical protein [Schinkia azotoformans]
MEKYIINYHTGVMKQVEVESLNEAKEIAKEGIAYTQENVTIESEGGEVITAANWYAVEPEEDDEVLVQVGGGFYQVWTDEL